MLRQPDLLEAQSSPPLLHSICMEASLLSRRRPWWSHLVSTQLTFALIRLRGVRCLAQVGSRRPCLTNTASRLCLSVSVPADWGRSRHRQHTGIAVPTWTRAVRTGVLPHPVRHMLRRMAVFVSLVSADGDNWARLICARVRGKV